MRTDAIFTAMISPVGSNLPRRRTNYDCQRQRRGPSVRPRYEPTDGKARTQVDPDGVTNA